MKINWLRIAVALFFAAGIGIMTVILTYAGTLIRQTVFIWPELITLVITVTTGGFIAYLLADYPGWWRDDK